MIRRGTMVPYKATPAHSWPHLGREHWPNYLALVLLAALLAASETWQPYRHVLYSASDAEIWKYSYPLRPNHVPAWAVPAVAISSPIAFIIAWHIVGAITPIEAHNAMLAAIHAVLFTGITTNFIKVNVGRPRPHFVSRCWPDGATPHFTPDGRPLCDDSAVNPAEGFKSFPSGHTAWSTAGLGFLSLWLMGRSRCFVGGGGAGASLRLAGSSLPLGLAVWIGASRLQDYWHHVEDIMAGFLLGLVMAFLFYRTAYAPLLSPQSGCLLETGSLKAAASTSNGGMRNTSRPELAGLRSGSLNGEPLYEYQMADKV